MSIIFLYLLTIMIWGSTWFAITLQLGQVDPIVSVFYRFSLASIILLVYCLIRKKTLRFTRSQHLWMALQGLLLFSVAYWMVYIAELYVASGLVAVVTSALIFLNIFFGALLLKTRISPVVLLGALIGISGIILIFRPELTSISLNDKETLGIVLTIISTVIYSLGNIVSARNQQKELPVLQTNAFSMGYAALVLLLITLTSGTPFTFEFSPQYVGSLFYLAIFGSVIAFGAYLTLIGRIGADRAAYGPLVVPVFALGLSALFEGYSWSLYSVIGIVLILGGNLLVLRVNMKKPVS